MTYIQCFMHPIPPGQVPIPCGQSTTLTLLVRCVKINKEDIKAINVNLSDSIVDPFPRDDSISKKEALLLKQEKVVDIFGKVITFIAWV